MQLSLIPLKVVNVLPRAPGTAAASAFVDAENGLEYVIKGKIGSVPVAANEWICTALAAEAGLAVPQAHILEMPDSELVFGSQVIGTVADQQQKIAILAKTATVHDAEKQFSSIYAFDLFVNNTDRHFNNYLFQLVSGVWRCFAYDFSHALFRDWPGSLPMPPCNTVDLRRGIEKIFPFDLKAAEATLDRLDKVSDSNVQAIINQMPPDWLDKTVADSFVSWWATGGAVTRAADIRKGLKDGSFL